MTQIKLSDGRIWEMSEVKVKNLQLAQKKETDLDKTIYLIAALTNNTTDDVENLPVEDFFELAEILRVKLDKKK